MIVRVDEIPEGGQDLLLNPAEPLLREALDAIGCPSDSQIDPHISGRLRVVKDGDLVFLVGEVSGKVDLQCSGCLQRFVEKRQLEVNLVFRRVQPGSEPAPGEDEAILFESPELDPTEALVQEFLLDLPMNPRCREDCPGLCPQCGSLAGGPDCHCVSPEPVNPRWAALAELKKKLDP